jgi:hypothetical protein
MLYMLQWLYTYVNSMSLIFHLFFRRMLQVCLFGYCIYSHTYVASILSECCVCLQWFSSVFQVFLPDASIKCSIFLSFLMLQVLHSNVLKVYRVVHVGCAWEAGGGASGPHGRTARAPAWPRDAGTGEQRSVGTGPCVDAGKCIVAHVRTSGR